MSELCGEIYAFDFWEGSYEAISKTDACEGILYDHPTCLNLANDDGSLIALGVAEFNDYDDCATATAFFPIAYNPDDVDPASRCVEYETLY